jgi:cytosine/adenosine deaminase-related metal-dependent hydrolase
VQDTQTDVRHGLAESLQFGTMLLGDVAAGGATWNELQHSPMRAVVFHEVLGLSNSRATPAWRDFLIWLRTVVLSDTCRPGVSPHAPYSVNQELIRSAAGAGAPVTIHLAESRTEIELLERRTGPFVPFLQGLGVWEPESLAPSVEWILGAASRASSVLFAHGNYLPADAPIPPRGTIIYCPRTHAAFGHAPHPFREFLARGVRVALGTDSLASNPDLDLLAEARFIHRRYPDFAGDALLRMATLSGAEALGWADETGSLTPGKSADLVVVPLPDRDDADPHRLVFDSDAPVSRVLFRGQWRDRA